MQPSENRRSVYQALAELSLDGWTTSVREVAARAGVSPTTAHWHLIALERDGQAERHPRPQQKACWRAVRAAA